MITIKPLTRPQAEQVLQSLYPNDQLPNAPEDWGTWQGTGRKLLHLSDPVRLSTISNLLDGKTPAGLRTVVPNPETPGRVVAWQFTFSLPPNHSLQPEAPAAFARQRLEAAHAGAVTSTLTHFGDQIVRTTDDPPWEVPPTAMFAAYRGTPTERHARQVQTTALFLNVGFVPDRSARTFQTEAVLRQAQGLEAVYRENLARELAKSPSQPQASQPRARTVELPRLQQSKEQGHHY